jgi:hypothetical protein
VPPPRPLAAPADAANRDALEKTRAELVRRIRERSDDFEATAALAAVNRELAELGWANPFSWEHRRKP